METRRERPTAAMDHYVPIWLYVGVCQLLAGVCPRKSRHPSVEAAFRDRGSAEKVAVDSSLRASRGSALRGGPLEPHR